jgi:hypothetical protein
MLAATSTASHGLVIGLPFRGVATPYVTHARWASDQPAGLREDYFASTLDTPLLATG